RRRERDNAHLQASHGVSSRPGDGGFRMCGTGSSASGKKGRHPMPDSLPPPELNVTTGPLPASRKIHVAGRATPDMRVPLREILLSPASGEPPVRVYDTSGPYTDPDARIDIHAGLPPLRAGWIAARDVEAYD